MAARCVPRFHWYCVENRVVVHQHSRAVFSALRSPSVQLSAPGSRPSWPVSFAATKLTLVSRFTALGREARSCRRSLVFAEGADVLIEESLAEGSPSLALNMQVCDRVNSLKTPAQ
jgi:hypothetical protein